LQQIVNIYQYYPHQLNSKKNTQVRGFTDFNVRGKEQPLAIADTRKTVAETTEYDIYISNQYANTQVSNARSGIMKRTVLVIKFITEVCIYY